MGLELQIESIPVSHHFLSRTAFFHDQHIYAIGENKSTIICVTDQKSTSVAGKITKHFKTQSFAGFIVDRNRLVNHAGEEIYVAKQPHIQAVYEHNGKLVVIERDANFSTGNPSRYVANRFSPGQDAEYITGGNRIKGNANTIAFEENFYVQLGELTKWLSINDETELELPSTFRDANHILNTPSIVAQEEDKYIVYDLEKQDFVSELRFKPRWAARFASGLTTYFGQMRLNSIVTATVIADQKTASATQVVEKLDGLENSSDVSEQNYLLAQTDKKRHVIIQQTTPIMIERNVKRVPHPEERYHITCGTHIYTVADKPVELGNGAIRRTQLRDIVAASKSEYATDTALIQVAQGTSAGAYHCIVLHQDRSLSFLTDSSQLQPTGQQVGEGRLNFFATGPNGEVYCCQSDGLHAYKIRLVDTA